MKRKYIPNLAQQISVCDANYARIKKLMPDLAEQNLREFTVQMGEQTVAIRIEVVERFAYTTTVKVSQHACGSAWLDAPDLVVRLYHDASMAEVVDTQHRQLSGRYLYPNPRMFQPDEKAQLNHYLAEWLSHSLQFGQYHEPISLV